VGEIVAKIVTVEQMRAIEKAADASGLTYAMMMENAGRGIAQEIIDRWPDLDGKRVAILVGPGNNGGDGLVIGHYLAEAGGQVAIYLAKPREVGDANLARLQERELLIANAEDDQRWRVLRNMMETVDIVVDALLGTGFRLPLEGVAKKLLKNAGAAVARRENRPFVVAVDCPSGLDCDTGEIAAEALCADLTVTLAAAKPGLIRFPGAQSVGELVVRDIGIAPDQKELAGVDLEMASPQSVSAHLPERPKNAHKGTFGRAIVVAGSVTFPGAASLAAVAAYRAGAGLVTVAGPTPIQGLVAPQLPEVTWILLPHEMGVIAADGVGILEKELESCQALLLGPGFGQDTATADFMRKMLMPEKRTQRGKIGFVHTEQGKAKARSGLPPCVIDADGLKLLTKIKNWPANLPPDTILTPHPGEMEVLTGEKKDAIQADRVGVARRWAGEWGHVVVLKGAFTVVAGSDGRATVLPFATAALARAGTGDVLAGAIVGLRAQGLQAYEAAVLGAYLHGRAGELAAEELGSEMSVLAGDVAEALPAAVADLHRTRRS
jgi:NAD(P)H-hydrate epimerase